MFNFGIFFLFYFYLCNTARVGISDVCPQNDLYHNRCDVIITSRMAVSKMVDNENVMVVVIYGSWFLPQPFYSQIMEYTGYSRLDSNTDSITVGNWTIIK